jgi:phospholipase C
MPPITRVVVLMMENHSFDRMLGWMQSVRPGLEGVDPAHLRSNPDWPGGFPIQQVPTASRNIADDPTHDLDNVLRQIGAGRMDGFVADFAQAHPSTGAPERQEIMGYYVRGSLPALHFLAESFVVCDHWFSSVPGPTWPNRLFAHSGTSLGHVDMPAGVFTPALHLYDQRTLYDEFQAAGVGWRIYYGDVPQSLVLTHQLGYAAHYRSFARWEADVAAGDLPAYVFIEPAYFGTEENDQHPPQDVLRGDALIARVYNALQANAALFRETLLVLLYDEHGGFYDHAPPPATVAPDGNTSVFAFNLLGVRVPAVLVSPWLDPGFISPVFDHTTLLRMAADLWPGVRPLGARALHANSPLPYLHWRDTPRMDLEPAPVPAVQAVQALPTLAAHKQPLFAFTQFLESKIRDPATRRALVRRSYEAMAGSLPQSALAQDRLDAFLAERQVAAPAQAGAPPA